MPRRHTTPTWPDAPDPSSPARGRAGRELLLSVWLPASVRLCRLCPVSLSVAFIADGRAPGCSGANTSPGRAVAGGSRPKLTSRPLFPGVPGGQGVGPVRAPGSGARHTHDVISTSLTGHGHWDNQPACGRPLGGPHAEADVRKHVDDSAVWGSKHGNDASGVQRQGARELSPQKPPQRPWGQ